MAHTSSTLKEQVTGQAMNEQMDSLMSDLLSLDPDLQLLHQQSMLPTY